MESREIKTCRGIVNYLEESATKNGGDINKALGLLHNSFFYIMVLISPIFFLDIFQKECIEYNLLKK